MEDILTTIVVKLQVEGQHCWPEAREKIPQMGFLSDPHRHMFHIDAKAEVSHGDREIEIIQFKREIQDYFKRNYFNEELNMCDFGRKSCEDLAKELMEAYDLMYCEVLEDNENGAAVWK